MLKKIFVSLVRLKQFIEVDIWRIALKKYSKPKYLLYKNFKVLLIAVKSFIIDDCAIKSSALTYFSLLSIVPVLAIAFAIAKGFRLESYLESQLQQLFAGQGEILQTSTEFAQKMLDTANGGLIAVISTVFLLYTVINLLTNVESIFNDVWEVKKGRSIERKLTDYLSIMIAGPILIILSSSLNVFITTQLQYYAQELGILGYAKPVIRFLIGLIPFFLFWLLFTLMYVIMPNTNVRVKPAIKSAAFAAIAYTITQWGYFEFQIGVSRYNAIYGSLAALPLFLIWLQISWMVVLFGAELTFAQQNVNTWEYNPEKLKMSQSFKKKMALIITSILVKRFEEVKTPLTALQISESIESPLRYVNQVLRELVDAKVLSEVLSKGKDEIGYQPAIDTNKLTIQYVINRISDLGLNNVHMMDSADRRRLESSLSLINDDKLISKGNLLLKDL